MAGEFWLQYNLRSAPGGMSSPDICRVALEQIEWADKLGVDAAILSEHHASEDGFNPSPLTFGAAVAARTRSMRIHPCALLLPLHDPIAIAEQAAVVDNISNGRLDLTIGAGYVPRDFAMFGIPLSERGKLLDEKLAALRRALSGERFDYNGRTVHVTPRPVQQPTGPRLYVGGAVAASARRAAKFGDGFFPSVENLELEKLYADTCAELGRPTGRILRMPSAMAAYVTLDPDAAWAKFAPYALHETHYYTRWAQEGKADIPTSTGLIDADALRATGLYRMVTPEQCIDLIKQQHDYCGAFLLSPLIAGLPADMAWEGLELFGSKVLPYFRKAAAA